LNGGPTNAAGKDAPITKPITRSFGRYLTKGKQQNKIMQGFYAKTVRADAATTSWPRIAPYFITRSHGINGIGGIRLQNSVSV